MCGENKAVFSMNIGIYFVILSMLINTESDIIRGYQGHMNLSLGASVTECKPPILDVEFGLYKFQ